MILRRKPLLLISGLTAAVLATAGIADTVLEHTVQQRIAQAASCQLRPSGPVTADLNGTLAGLRVLGGDVGTVRIDADQVRRDGVDANVAAVLNGVTTDGAITGGTATATIGYAQLQRQLAAQEPDLVLGGDGSKLTATGTVDGIPLPLTVDIAVSTTPSSLTATPTGITVLGRTIPVSKLSALPGASSLSGQLKPRTVALPTMPDGVRLTAAHPDSTGLALVLTIPAGHPGTATPGCPRVD